jgi:hypothetical protein
MTMAEVAEEAGISERVILGPPEKRTFLNSDLNHELFPSHLLMI